MSNIEYDNEKEFNELFDKLEPMPDGFAMSVSDMERLTLSCNYSIAISLKRIADVLCDNDKRRSFGK